MAWFGGAHHDSTIKILSTSVPLRLCSGQAATEGDSSNKVGTQLLFIVGRSIAIIFMLFITLHTDS